MVTLTELMQTIDAGAAQANCQSVEERSIDVNVMIEQHAVLKRHCAELSQAHNQALANIVVAQRSSADWYLWVSSALSVAFVVVLHPPRCLWIVELSYSHFSLVESISHSH